MSSGEGRFRLDVDPDIARAQTPPAALYRDADAHRTLVDRVLAPSWQAYTRSLPSRPGDAMPWTRLGGSVDDPLVWVCDEPGESEEARVRCLANVCTHRGKRVVDAPCSGLKTLRCGYHGRRFGLDGSLRHAPGFEDAIDFPRASDDLARPEVARWGPLRFVARPGSHAFADLYADSLAPLQFMAEADYAFDDDARVEYLVDAHWALYIDNYLEGFHIPFVHPTLNAALDWSRYETRLTPNGVLQVGYSDDPSSCFALPSEHADHAADVAAYYLFLFPNTMINLYPWGISLNVVEPLGPARTRVTFARWVCDASRLEQGAGAGLDAVEDEDEAVVESTFAGLASPHYPRGRYAPRHERGVHHFHRLLADALDAD